MSLKKIYSMEKKMSKKLEPGELSLREGETRQGRRWASISSMLAYYEKLEPEDEQD